MTEAASAPEPVLPPTRRLSAAIFLQGPRCELCGQPIASQRASQRVGRPRTTCSEACRRALDHRRRMIAQRVRWIDAWLAEVGRGRYTKKHIEREVRTLREEIRALRLPPVAALEETSHGKEE